MSVLRPFSLIALAALALAVRADDRATLNSNPDWRFIKADVPDAPRADCDDRAWAVVSTPHTFNDVDTFDNWSLPGHRGEQNQWSGVTWYRKTFDAPAAWSGRRVFIEFEAVRQVARVYLNGEYLGVSKTGFTPFGFDLTSKLRPGAPNVLAVCVDNRFIRDPLDPGSTENPNLRQLSERVNEAVPERIEDLQADQIPWNNPHWHPAHGGIYRNVRLIVTDPLHITLPLYSFLQTEGPYAYATDISPASARVSVEIPVENGRADTQAVEIAIDVLDRSERTVLSAHETRRLPPGDRTRVTLGGVIAQPRLWEPADPHVYTVRCSIRRDGTVIDSTSIPLGIRAARWDASEGFFINGKHLRLRGWGQKPTDEWPGLGAALPDWLHFYTLGLMKQAGGNYLRWGHAAATRAQIDAADALGLITLQPGVDGESDTVKAAWALRSAAFRDVVIYFRNHPSILVWEGGNQKVTREHAAELRATMDRYDPHGGRAFTFRRADRVVAEFTDIGEGTEGGRELVDQPVVEGEYDREESPRRVWDEFSPPKFGYPEARGMTYQLTSEQYAVNQVAQFRKIAARDHAGGANWIFSDSTSGGRVPAEVARASGEVDGVRLPKEAYYVCSVLFRADPQVHLIGHWTYPAGTRKTVYVVANTDAVELTLNGKSLGHGRRTDGYLFTFADVAFAPGELRANASNHGQVVATHTLQTAGEPVALKLTPIVAPGGWRADGQDVALVDVEAVDAEGRRCPTFERPVEFQLDGPAVWRGGYNSGRPNSINATTLELECGINRVSLRATRSAGTVTLRASAPGLAPASLRLEARAAAVANGMTPTMPVMPTVALAAQPATHPAFSAPTALIKSAGTARAARPELGRYVKRLNYTGPGAASVQVGHDLGANSAVFADRSDTLAVVPPALAGADWVRAASADAAYSAVDLMELEVAANTVVTIAHDEALPAPAWLQRDFTPADDRVVIGRRPMRLFRRHCAKPMSLTLGSNTDRATTDGALMYLVFVRQSPAAGP